VITYYVLGWLLNRQLPYAQRCEDLLLLLNAVEFGRG
jgi:hypothetical protein